MSNPQVQGFFDPDTATISYVVSDPESGQCALIDSVLDFDPKSGRTSTQSADRLVNAVRDQGLQVQWILETHVHADHLSAAPYLQQQLGGKLAIGAHVDRVQDRFAAVFNAGDDFARDGSQFDRLFADGDSFEVGRIAAHAIHTPGHTPGCMTYVIGNSCFVGDTLFMPDYGTARCDFPGGDARQLYRSIQKIFALPEDTRLFLCHDYLPDERSDHRWETTVADQKKGNIHIHEGISEDDFVRMRTERDAGLQMPRLLLPSVQVNMRAGSLPPAESNGVHYLKIPVNLL